MHFLFLQNKKQPLENSSKILNIFSLSQENLFWPKNVTVSIHFFISSTTYHQKIVVDTR